MAPPVVAPVAAPVVAAPVASPVATPIVPVVTAPTGGKVPPDATGAGIDMGTVVAILASGLSFVAIVGYFVTHFEVRNALLRGGDAAFSDTSPHETKVGSFRAAGPFRAVAPDGAIAKYPDQLVVSAPQ
jgi:hypothetical protein